MKTQDPGVAERREARDQDALIGLQAEVMRTRDQGDGHLELGLRCEEAGAFELAFREYQLALRQHPRDPELLTRLAQCYEERGNLDHAVECAQRAWHLDRSDAATTELLLDLLRSGQMFSRARQMLDEAALAGCEPQHVDAFRARIDADQGKHEDEERTADEAEVLQLQDADLIRFQRLFQGRENVYARQWIRDGGETGYTPVREPLSVEVLRNHVLGNLTVGVYPIRLDDTVSFATFDLDLTKRSLEQARGEAAEARRLRTLVESEARRLSEALAHYGLVGVMEDSGYKGRHIWIFFEQPEPAAVVRRLGELSLAAHGPLPLELGVEFFPRQSSAGKGLGNLIKLPLGIHRRTGRRCRLLDDQGEGVAAPFAHLRSAPRLDHAVLLQAIERLQATAAGREPLRSESVRRDAAETPVGLEVLPPELPPPWTKADFDHNPEISTLLRSCPVLARIRETAEAHRQLSHEERIVLKHTMGHSAAGVLAVNYLLDLCLDTPPGEALVSPLRGNPISCPKIRKRVPQITARVRCGCLFPHEPNQYPTPRLHLLAPPPEAEETPVSTPGSDRSDVLDRARVLGLLRDQRRRLESETRDLERRLSEWMDANAVSDLDLGDARLVMRLQGGGPSTLVFEPGGAVERAGESRAANEETATLEQAEPVS